MTITILNVYYNIPPEGVDAEMEKDITEALAKHEYIRSAAIGNPPNRPGNLRDLQFTKGREAKTLADSTGIQPQADAQKKEKPDGA